MPDGLAARVDEADLVIRFNLPQGGPERIGLRTDMLFLINSGKAMQAWLADPAFWASPHVISAKRVVLPLHPAVIRDHHPRPNILSRLKGRRADWTAAAIAALGAAGKETSVLPVPFYASACEELGIAESRRGEVFPSTGFLGLFYALNVFAPPQWRVELAGFGFSGWKRHDWQAERLWVGRAVAQGRLQPLAPQDAAPPRIG
jgi:hypothetical protein